MKATTRLLDSICPKQYLTSILDIDLEGLAGKGYRALILDLDNTLTAWHCLQIPVEVREWLKKAQTSGFRLCLVSNALENRVEETMGRLGLDFPFVAQAAKPTRGGYERALLVLGTTPAQTASVGDQLFTDILGGNRMGLYTILVQPRAKKELITTRMIRVLEWFALRAMRRRGCIQRRGTGCVSGVGG